MPDFSKIRLFRMTHVDNIAHILKHGITHISSPNSNKSYVPIGDTSLISNRATTPLANGQLLGNYIPFYFGARMPMLFVVQNGYNSVKITPQEAIVYCVVPVQEILQLQLPFLFTDGHAVNSYTNFYKPADIDELENLVDFKAIQAKYWISETDLDLKRRKEAEFLVGANIPHSAIKDYIVYNEKAKHQLLRTGVPENMIVIKPSYYF